MTEQGATSRSVYLPAGTDWYNYWTNERVPGGQAIKVDAPIEVLPLFVKAGAIIPLGSAIENTGQEQKIEHVRVYPGADSDFTLYSDDGKTDAYETGDFKTTHLRWNDAAQKLTREGTPAWTEPDERIVEIVKR